MARYALHHIPMMFERTFSIANDWYWRINENTTTLTLEEALCDFVRPLVALLDRTAEVVAVDAELVVGFAEQSTRIALAANVTARFAIKHLISDLNRMLEGARLGQAFAIVIPRRYELCGALLGAAELERLWGNPMLLVPASRHSWNAP